MDFGTDLLLVMTNSLLLKTGLEIVSLSIEMVIPKFFVNVYQRVTEWQKSLPLPNGWLPPR